MTTLKSININKKLNLVFPICFVYWCTWLGCTYNYHVVSPSRIHETVIASVTCFSFQFSLFTLFCSGSQMKMKIKAKTNSVTAKQRNLCVWKTFQYTPMEEGGSRGRCGGRDAINGSVPQRTENTIHCVLLLYYVSHWRRSVAQHLLIFNRQ